MSLLSLQNKLFGIFGIHQSGKTELAKFISSQYHSIIFDTISEFDTNKVDVYRPIAKEYPEIANECERFIQKFSRAGYNMMYFSEISRICPSMKPLLPNMRALIDDYRHRGLSVGYDCRRPQDMTSSIVAVTKDIFVFGMTGQQDIDYMKNFNRELGDNTLFSLPNFHFVHFFGNRQFELCQPVVIK